MLARLDFLLKMSRIAQTHVSMHRHRCYELVYYSTGTGSTRIGSIEFQYGPNMYAIIPPDLLHDEHRTEQTDVICIGFSLTSSEVPPLQPGLFPDSPSGLILQILHNISAELQEKTAYYAQKLSLYTSEMVIEHLRFMTTGQSSLPDDNLIYARTFIEENFSQKISVKDLADMSGYSYHHFRHLFKTKFGLSPIQYLISKRLEKARNLLRFTNLSITSITIECGFTNDAQFCTIFKREIGETPRSYRHNSSFRNTLYQSPH